MMLQQDKADDFVIATGVQYRVRDFVNAAAADLGFTLEWKGKGAQEEGIVQTVSVDAGLQPGQVIVKVDPRYFRPTEVETLLGDPTKAREKLGWTPTTTFAELVSEMMREDLNSARRDVLVKQHGFTAYDYHE
jgi:GDPmannose 4,6-dehydratase